MTDQQPVADDEVIEVDQTDRRSMVPFIAAAVVAVIVIVAIVLGGMLSPAEKNVTDSDKISAAVHRYAEARGTSGPAVPQGVVCQGFDESKSALAAQFADAEFGKSIDVPKIENPMVDGNRAKATVTTKIDGKEDTATWNLTRAGDRWVVCN
jgi:hypothetical protein